MQASLERHWQASLDPSESLFAWKKKAWDRFQEIGVPRLKQEAFQYLHLQKLAFPKKAEKKGVTAADIAPHILPECRDSYLVFVDGYYDATLSKVNAPLICLPLEEAMRSYGLFLQNRLSRALKEESDPFAALNGAFFGKGAFLYAPPKTQIAPPLQILHFFTGHEMASPRLQLYLGKGASLTIAETAFHRGLTFCNSACDVALDEGAEIFFCDLQEFPAASQAFHSFRATLKRDSRLKWLSATRGAKLARSSIQVQLTEENGEAELLGMSRLRGEAQSHFHVTVDHQAPNARSRQHFKGILRDRSRCSFEGKIAVRPIAQKTEAYQLNNNLLLSDEASANAKPNLEIFADDVKASHGATVSQLNEEELFYLRSRGLPLDAAKKWLAAGFLRELIERIPLPSIRQKWAKEE